MTKKADCAAYNIAEEPNHRLIKAKIHINAKLHCTSFPVASLYIAMLMYLTLNGSNNCTAIAPRPCNGRPMLWRGLEVVVIIIIIIIIISLTDRNQSITEKVNS